VVALIWYGSDRISKEEMTQGMFLSFIFAAFMMYTPVKKLSRVNANLQQAMAASERIFGLLDKHTEVKERADAVPLPPLRRGIDFRNVVFAYGEGQEILRDVSFHVAAGQMVAIVGLSGAGKTTLVNLIPRFYDVTGGAILIDGADIRDVTLRSLRAQVGIVTQETVLFDDTVANNIAYGSPAASREDIEAAAHAAHAHEFIVNLPGRYGYLVGEAVGRSASAAGDRPRAAEELADPDPGRGDVLPRCRVGAARAGRARQPDAEPDRVRDRASPLDGAPGGQDRGAGARPRGGDRPPRRAPGESRQCLLEAVRAAGLRTGAGSRGAGGEVVMSS
jgi:subfamily B ATP-binding cassette protein MsbA